MYLFMFVGVIQYTTTPRRHQCVRASTTAVLSCAVTATPPARITWMKNGSPISKADHHYLILTKHDHTHSLSTLLVYDTSLADNGWYTCVASSSAVYDRKSGYIYVSPSCGEWTSKVIMTGLHSDARFIVEGKSCPFWAVTFTICDQMPLCYTL